MIDWKVRRLPDVLTLPMAAVTALLLGIVALLPGHHGSWITAMAGALVVGAFYLLLALTNQRDGTG